MTEEERLIFAMATDHDEVILKFEEPSVGVIGCLQAELAVSVQSTSAE